MNPPTTGIGAPYIPGWHQLRVFSAEIWLMITVVAVLLAPFFVRRAKRLCAAVALGGTLLAAFSLVVVGHDPSLMGTYFNGMLVFDPVAYGWKIILLLFVAGVIVMTMGTTLRKLREDDGAEFFTLLIGATLGMSLMASAANLLMIFIAIELASLPSYVLAGFRKTHRLGAEAAVKYVLFGSAVSAITAYGLSLLYGLFGTLQLSEIAAAIPNNHAGPILAMAILAVCVGIGFKISAVPFHLWCPDVFDGAGIDVTTFLSVASKGAGLVLLLRIGQTFAAAESANSHGVAYWLAIGIGLIGAVTATLGNLAAFAQNSIKRLLAYSSIAQAGYMLCAVSILTPSAAASSAQAALLYLAVYALMNLGAFAIAAAVSPDTDPTLAHFRGLGWRNPLAAAAMLVCLVSLVGLPPFAGFSAKLNLMWVLFHGGSGWRYLVIVVALNTVISAFYYFRILRAMYFESGDENMPVVKTSPIAVGIGVVCAAALVFFFFAFNPLQLWTARVSGLYIAPPSAIAER